MLDKLMPPPLTQMGPPLSAYRFVVVFFGIGNLPIPNPIDIRFKSVSGLRYSLTPKKEMKLDGEKLSVMESSGEKTLTLSRGFIPGLSLLRKEIEVIIASKDEKFNPREILVIAMDDVGLPMAAWLVRNAILSEYSISGFDADQNGLLIEEMQFTYKEFVQISI